MKIILSRFIPIICKRKSVLIFFLIILSLKSFTQIYKGQWLIGGNAAFSYSQANEYNNKIKLSSLTFSPSGGLFFLNRLAGGLKFDLGEETYHYTSISKSRNTFISIGPFLRYYFLQPEQKINLFAEGGYGFSFGKYRNFYDVNYTYHSSTFSFKAGPALLLNEHTALEVTLGYIHSTRGPIDTAVTNVIQIGVGLQIHFGKRKD
jgi:hypothetical protein